mgnify:CR=1 FL=1
MKIGRARNNVDTPDASKASNSRYFVKNENVKSVDIKQAIGNSREGIGKNNRTYGF